MAPFWNYGSTAAASCPTLGSSFSTILSPCRKSSPAGYVSGRPFLEPAAAEASGGCEPRPRPAASFLVSPFLFQPIKFRGEVRLNVEEKKTRSAREGERRDTRPRGPGGPRDRPGGIRGPPSRGAAAQKPSFGAGRGTGSGDSRYSGQRQ